MTATDIKVLRLIGLSKLLKAALLIAVGVGALKLVNTDISSFVDGWVSRFGLDPGSRYVGRIVLQAASLTPNKIKDLGVGSFVFAGVFLTEGAGL